MKLDELTPISGRAPEKEKVLDKIKYPEMKRGLHAER